MTATAEIEAGIAVEIGKIDKELGRLWESTDDSKARASLVNLAIFTEEAGAIAENTGMIARIASEHACRALLIFANPKAPESRAQAWINAHCHFTGKGDRQICSEQITFQLDGKAAESLPNIVFSHLDSDLPLCFWRQGNFREPLDEKLWIWVDRLIFDSADWTDLPGQFSIVRKIAKLTGDRTVLCDLNWSRLLGTRFALAQLFDHSYALDRLRNIDRVTITCGKRATGLLLLGWLAAQLDWKFQSLMGRDSFQSPAGKAVEFEIEETGGCGIGACKFESDGVTLEMTRDAQSDYFHARMTCGDEPCKSLLLAAGKSSTADVLLIELSRGGRHPLYIKALAAIEGLL